MREQVPTILPEHARFRGLLTFRVAARVDGELEGAVVAGGLLIVGPRGRVRGHVQVGELILAGELEGEVRAASRLELLAGARLAGDLWTPRLAVADGARLEGRCRAGLPGGASGSCRPRSGPGASNALKARPVLQP